MPLLVQSVVYFITWVVGNWALCTLLDGEGTFKKIFIYSAYALVPYIVCTFIAVILSNVLIKDESIWITAVQWIGLGWSGINGGNAYSNASYTVPCSTAHIAVPAALCFHLSDLYRNSLQDQRLTYRNGGVK